MRAIGNFLWFIFAGIWLAIGHIVSAVSLARAPIGKTIVGKEVAAAARAANGAAAAASLRREG